VIWWENIWGFFPEIPMFFYYPDDFFDYIGVVPEDEEPCTVTVYLDPLNSTLIKATVLSPNPENSVYIEVDLLRAPSNHLETATISGYWIATGLPTGEFCDATNTNSFSVPITVSEETLSADKQEINLDAGFNCTLQMSDSLTGPWWTVGVGQTFSAYNDAIVGFFRRSKELGGYVHGKVTDKSGKPLSNIALSLIYGGASAMTDTNGDFAFADRLHKGMKVYQATGPNGAILNFADEGVAEGGDTNDTTENYEVEMDGETNDVVTNVCNCTPWCAIGFASSSAGQTPVYYSGGANPPKTGTPNCEEPEVTVTPPSGKSYKITAGTHERQNSGANPAAGTWTVTTVVCGITKTVSIDVP